MKPRKMKKFKQRVQFREAHGGLSMLQMHVAAHELAQRIARDPAKFSAFVAAVADVLDMPEQRG